MSGFKSAMKVSNARERGCDECPSPRLLKRDVPLILGHGEKEGHGLT